MQLTAEAQELSPSLWGAVTPNRRRGTVVDRKKNAETRRLRLAGSLDPSTVRALVAALQPGSDTRVEVVYPDGRRLPVASGLDRSAIRALLAAVEADRDCWIELALPVE